MKTEFLAASARFNFSPIPEAPSFEENDSPTRPHSQEKKFVFPVQPAGCWLDHSKDTAQRTDSSKLSSSTKRKGAKRRKGQSTIEPVFAIRDLEKYPLKSNVLALTRESEFKFVFSLLSAVKKLDAILRGIQPHKSFKYRLIGERDSIFEESESISAGHHGSVSIPRFVVHYFESDCPVPNTLHARNHSGLETSACLETAIIGEGGKVS